MEYIKIPSLWKREIYVKGLPKGTHGPLIIGGYSDTESEAYPSVILFGEGYGPKIQAAGSNYRKDVGFILFDIRCGWCLKREDVIEVAKTLDVPVVPEIGIMTEEEVVDFVKSKPLSLCSMHPQMMEGVVCRSEPLMLFRNGRPLMWKLKTREF